MPTINAITKSSKQVWASPDGQKKIFKVLLEVDGAEMQASTYSDAIAKVGWAGEVETYEKTGKFGIETFVKQAKKEGYGGYPNKGTKPQGDQYTMYLSYAKDVLVAQINNGAKPDFDVAMQTIIAGGHMLYDSRPNAIASVEPIKEELPAKSELDSLFDAEPESQWKS